MVQSPETDAEDRKLNRGFAPWFVLLLLVLGIGLRAVQYFGFVDMWHDELAIARNLEDRSLGELATEPLDYQQVAPVGFLAATDLGTQVFGFSNAGIRLVPFLFSVAGVLLFWRILRRFASGWAMAASLGLFAVSPALFWYGSTVKPYGMDVTVSLLLAWLALRYLERPDDVRRGVVAGLSGLLAIPISFPAAPTGALVGLVLVFAWWRREAPKNLAPLAALGVGWAAGAAYSTWSALSLVDSATDEFMRDFWAGAFPPDGLGAALAWTGEQIFRNFAHSLYFLPPINPVFVLIAAAPLAMAVVGLGFVLAGRASTDAIRSHDRLAVLVVPAPLITAIALTFAEVLPYEQRLSLYSNWPILVLAGLGLQGLIWSSDGWPRWMRWTPRALALLMFLPLTLLIVVMGAPPYDSGEPPPGQVLEGLAERRQPGDVIYVYTLGRHDMAFYGRRAGIETDEWIEGTRNYEDRRGYLRELDPLRGEPRAWFFWVQLGGSKPEYKMLVDYLSTIGRELERIPNDLDLETRASAWGGAILFDLSDPDLLEKASAETFEIPDYLADS